MGSTPEFLKPNQLRSRASHVCRPSKVQSYAVDNRTQRSEDNIVNHNSNVDRATTSDVENDAGYEAEVFEDCAPEVKQSFLRRLLRRLCGQSRAGNVATDDCGCKCTTRGTQTDSLKEEGSASLPAKDEDALRKQYSENVVDTFNIVDNGVHEEDKNIKKDNGKSRVSPIGRTGENNTPGCEDEEQFLKANKVSQPVSKVVATTGDGKFDVRDSKCLSEDDGMSYISRVSKTGKDRTPDFQGNERSAKCTEANRALRLSRNGLGNESEIKGGKQISRPSKIRHVSIDPGTEENRTPVCENDKRFSRVSGTEYDRRAEVEDGKHSSKASQLSRISRVSENEDECEEDERILRTSIISHVLRSEGNKDDRISELEQDKRNFISTILSCPSRKSVTLEHEDYGRFEKDSGACNCSRLSDIDCDRILDAEVDGRASTGSEVRRLSKENGDEEDTSPANEDAKRFSRVGRESRVSKDSETRGDRRSKVEGEELISATSGAARLSKEIRNEQDTTTALDDDNRIPGVRGISHVSRDTGTRSERRSTVEAGRRKSRASGNTRPSMQNEIVDNRASTADYRQHSSHTSEDIRASEPLESDGDGRSNVGDVERFPRASRISRISKFSETGGYGKSDVEDSKLFSSKRDLTGTSRVNETGKDRTPASEDDREHSKAGGVGNVGKTRSGRKSDVKDGFLRTSEVGEVSRGSNPKSNRRSTFDDSKRFSRAGAVRRTLEARKRTENKKPYDTRISRNSSVSEFNRTSRVRESKRNRTPEYKDDKQSSRASRASHVSKVNQTGRYKRSYVKDGNEFARSSRSSHSSKPSETGKDRTPELDGNTRLSVEKRVGHISKVDGTRGDRVSDADDGKRFSRNSGVSHLSRYSETDENRTSNPADDKRISEKIEVDEVNRFADDERFSSSSGVSRVLSLTKTEDNERSEVGDNERIAKVGASIVSDTPNNRTSKIKDDENSSRGIEGGLVLRESDCDRRSEVEDDIRFSRESGPDRITTVCEAEEERTPENVKRQSIADEVGRVSRNSRTEYDKRSAIEYDRRSSRASGASRISKVSENVKYVKPDFADDQRLSRANSAGQVFNEDECDRKSQVLDVKTNIVSLISRSSIPEECKSMEFEDNMQPTKFSRASKFSKLSGTEGNRIVEIEDCRCVARLSRVGQTGDEIASDVQDSQRFSRTNGDRRTSIICDIEGKTKTKAVIGKDVRKASNVSDISRCVELGEYGSPIVQDGNRFLKISEVSPASECVETREQRMSEYEDDKRYPTIDKIDRAWNPRVSEIEYSKTKTSEVTNGRKLLRNSCVSRISQVGESEEINITSSKDNQRLSNSEGRDRISRINVSVARRRSEVEDDDRLSRAIDASRHSVFGSTEDGRSEDVGRKRTSRESNAGRTSRSSKDSVSDVKENANHVMRSRLLSGTRPAGASNSSTPECIENPRHPASDRNTRGMQAYRLSDESGDKSAQNAKVISKRSTTSTLILRGDREVLMEGCSNSRASDANRIPEDSRREYSRNSENTNDKCLSIASALINSGRVDGTGDERTSKVDDDKRSMRISNTTSFSIVSKTGEDGISKVKIAQGTSGDCRSSKINKITESRKPLDEGSKCFSSASGPISVAPFSNTSSDRESTFNDVQGSPRGSHLTPCARISETVYEGKSEVDEDEYFLRSCSIASLPKLNDTGNKSISDEDDCGRFSRISDFCSQSNVGDTRDARTSKDGKRLSGDSGVTRRSRISKNEEDRLSEVDDDERVWRANARHFETIRTKRTSDCTNVSATEVEDIKGQSETGGVVMVSKVRDVSTQGVEAYESITDGKLLYTTSFLDVGRRVSAIRDEEGKRLFELRGVLPMSDVSGARTSIDDEMLCVSTSSVLKDNESDYRAKAGDIASNFGNSSQAMRNTGNGAPSSSSRSVRGQVGGGVVKAKNYNEFMERIQQFCPKCQPDLGDTSSSPAHEESPNDRGQRPSYINPMCAGTSQYGGDNGGACNIASFQYQRRTFSCGPQWNNSSSAAVDRRRDRFSSSSGLVSEVHRGRPHWLVCNSTSVVAGKKELETMADELPRSDVSSTCARKCVKFSTAASSCQ